MMPSGETLTEMDQTTVVSAGECLSFHGIHLTARIRTSVILVKYQVGLGVLAMPSYMHTLGLIPGIIVIIAVGLMTTWTDYIVGSFKKAHPEVYTLAE